MIAEIGLERGEVLDKQYAVEHPDRPMPRALYLASDEVIVVGCRVEDLSGSVRAAGTGHGLLGIACTSDARSATTVIAWNFFNFLAS